MFSVKQEISYLRRSRKVEWELMGVVGDLGVVNLGISCVTFFLAGLKDVRVLHVSLELTLVSSS